MESVAFKEWSMVCDALGRGEQSIILRKGGIAEGRDGFSFKHPEFFLFPTWFHEQPRKMRVVGTEIPLPDEDKIRLNFFAELELSRTITSWEIVQALEPWHNFRPEVVRERFEYDKAPGVHVAFVRVFRIAPEWILPNEKRYGGCRSWVQLPTPPADLRFEPILSDAEQAKRKQEFLGIIGEKTGGPVAASSHRRPN